MNAIADPQIVLPLPTSGPTGLVEFPGSVDADVRVGPHPDVLGRPGAHRGLLVAADVACALIGVVSAAAWGVSVALLVGVPLLWIFLIALNRGYESRLVPVGSQDLSRVTRTGLQLAVIGAALVWTLDWNTERTELVALVAVTTGLSLGHRMLGTATTHWLRSRGGTAARRVVIAGHPHQVEPVITELARARTTVFEVAGVCLPHNNHDRDAHWQDHWQDHWDDDRGHHRENDLDELLALVRSEAADAVILLPCDHVSPQVLRRLTWELETADAQLFVAPGILDVAESRSTIAYAGGLPMVHIRPAELRGARQIFKAGVERTLALLAVVALAPVFLSLMLAIMIDSRGNPIYRQLRVGREGHEFTMFKLRTMTTDADRRVAELDEQNQAGGVLFKIRADPRITRLGRLLRRYSLDELPQLVNVLFGHMSLVGPRPALPVEVERYESDVHRRLAVRPGVTGLWQVSGRSDLSWEESVRLDLTYVDNWSLWSDVKILLRTARAVVGHAGAY